MSDGSKSEKPRPQPQPRAQPVVEPETGGTRAGGIAGILAERQRAASEAVYRNTGGAAGDAPGERMAAERRSLTDNIQRKINRMAVMRAVDGAPSRAKAKIPDGTGNALSGEVRSKMEPKLGADLSDVRVHTGGDSQRSANDFGARAYTVGSDIHFNAGEFKPGSKEGDKLLAHELTHVVQGQKSGVQRKAKEVEGDDMASAEEPEVSQPSDPAEVEADAMGEHVADELHEDGADGAEAEPGGAKPDVKEQKADKPAPQVQAKLSGVGRKVLLTKKDDATPKPSAAKAGATAKANTPGKAGTEKSPATGSAGAGNAGPGKGSCPIAKSAVDAQVSERGKQLQMDFLAHTLDGTKVSLGFGYVSMDEHGAALGAPQFTLDTTVMYKGKECAAHIFDSVEMGPGGVLVGKGSKTPFTKLALERFIAFYKRRFGHEPEKLAGLLAWENKQNFQREFYKLTSKMKMGRPAAAEAAIRKISFGAHRIALGYDKFEVTLGDDAPAALGTDRETGKDMGTHDVPSKVEVIASKSKSK